jgi:tRNA U34 2-thiouridine synthase MnmA/TrmU
VSQYINYLLVLIAIKINPTSFVNYRKNNWLNHYFYWELTKPEVREIAAKMELVTAERKTLKVCVL